MPLHKMKFRGAMKKLHLRAPKLDLSPHSPTNTLLFDDDSDSESRRPGRIPGDIPKGFFAVYVGEECRRYVIPVSYLNHQAFKVLLGRAEEEFGFDHGGAIRLPCNVAFFERLLWLLGRADPAVKSLEIEELLQLNL